MTVVFVWFYLVTGVVIGPFHTQKDCDEIRAYHAKFTYASPSRCWQAPAPVMGVKQ